MEFCDWEMWSCECRLVVTEAGVLDEARGLLDPFLAEITAACSRFEDTSELMRLRDGDNLLSPLLAELVRAALEAASRTEGAVDPTVGSALVGLGYDRDLKEVSAARVTVHRVPGWRSLALAGDVLTLPRGVQLDLGATAKAFAADRGARLVADRLHTGVLLSLGGDIATAGPGPEEGWQITVQDLPEDPAQQITLAPGAAVATSSSVRRTWGDGEAHHIVDPATGLPSSTPWRSVTVVAPSCLEANTATTATLARGATGLAWLKSAGLPARLLGHGGGLATTQGWPVEVAA